MKKSFGIVYYTIIILISLNGIIGCSYRANVNSMIPGNYDLKQNHPHSINIIVSGAEETDPEVDLMMSMITNESFKEALKNSIVNSNLFSKVVDDTNSNYLLDVRIVNISRPAPGTSMHVKMIANWKLIETGINKEIWQDLIVTSHTAGAFAAFVGTKRMKMALEGAAKNNILKGIDSLSAIDL
jgi:hypothetical protein